MSKRYRRDRENKERGAIDVTNELDSLLKLHPDYTPIFTNNPTLQADLTPLELKDRRYTAPSPVGSLKKTPRASTRGISIRSLNNRDYGLFRQIVCKRRQERKEVLHAEFKKRGGLGSAVKNFNKPIKRAVSKIICGR